MLSRQLLKRSDQFTVSNLSLKKLLQSGRALLNFMKIPGGVFLVVPAVTRTNNVQLFFVKGREKHERFKISIGSNTDTSIVLHMTLQQGEGRVPA